MGMYLIDFYTSGLMYSEIGPDPVFCKICFIFHMRMKFWSRSNQAAGSGRATGAQGWSNAWGWQPAVSRSRPPLPSCQTYS